MTPDTEKHAPTPAFRAALEQEVVDALRREVQFAPSNRFLRGPRLRTAMAMAAGMLLAVSTQFAAGQVQDARQRDSLTTMLDARKQLATLRMELARQELARAQGSFDAGVITKEVLATAQSDVRAMETALARLQLELEEVRGSALAPRDELWAPLVGARDFVKERMHLDLALAEDRLRAAERGAEEAERRVQVGIVSKGEADAARAGVLDATSELELLSAKLGVRDQFVRGQLTAEEVARRVDRIELEHALKRVLLRLQQARERMRSLRYRQRVGVTSEFEAKKAELDALELQMAAERLQAQLDAVRAAIRR